MDILSREQSYLVQKERETLNTLNTLLSSFDDSSEDCTTLSDAIERLNNLFLLVVVGEFNSGKSAFINALLGGTYLKEGVTPTTSKITLVQYGDAFQEKLLTKNTTVTYVPVEWLKDINIVDTPGTNAIIRSHEELTSQFIPRSDIVLFITSVDRPFTESEKQFLSKIQDWGKKVVLVINKIDILDNKDDLFKVIKYVSENTTKLLGIKPNIFPVSSRNALVAKNGEQNLWDLSRFEQLEQYIHNTLDAKERIILKLLNPLGVGMHLVHKHQKEIDTRLSLLESDLSIINEINKQLDIYKEDMYQDFHYRIADIDNALLEMEKRGDYFFDETFRLTKVIDLLNKNKIRSEFERRVITNLPQIIEQKVGEIIDWLVDSDFKQWQAIHDYIEERKYIHRKKIIGDMGKSKFNYARDRIIDKVSRDTQMIVDQYDKNAVTKQIADDAQTAVAASAALEVGAIGLGTLITTLATTAAADVTGILLASFVAVLGLFVIPTQRRLAKKDMTERITNLRKQLITSLRNQIEKEIDRSITKINEAISPYTRFVRAERNNLESSKNNLQQIEQALEQLKHQIKNL